MRSSIAALLCTVAMHAAAQLAPVDPDWRESEAPRPPVPSTTGLIPIDVPGATLRYGIDPASISLGADGIVRYVVVASSPSGTLNATYEGIRCNTGDVRVYARFDPDKASWTPTSSAAWRPLQEGRPFRHSLTVARTGACMGHSANRSVAQILRDLRAPVDRRFHNTGD